MLREPEMRGMRREPAPALGAKGHCLSPRQLEILELLAEGQRVQAISVRLGVSVATVRNHVHAVLARLGCHSQLEAVAAARRSGLIGG